MPQMSPVLRKSIATVCLSGTLPDKLAAAAAAGFQGVEIFENDLLTYEGCAADIKNWYDAVVPGGMMIFPDSYMTSHNGVQDAIVDFLDRSRSPLTTATSWGPVDPMRNRLTRWCSCWSRRTRESESERG